MLCLILCGVRSGPLSFLFFLPVTRQSDGRWRVSLVTDERVRSWRSILDGFISAWRFLSVDWPSLPKTCVSQCALKCDVTSPTSVQHVLSFSFEVCMRVDCLACYGQASMILVGFLGYDSASMDGDGRMRRFFFTLFATGGRENIFHILLQCTIFRSWVNNWILVTI